LPKRLTARSRWALLLGDQRGERDELAVVVAHLEAGEVLRPRALGREQPQPHVDAPASGAVLAHPDAADQGIEGSRHRLGRDAEVGGERPVR
jgi:hypothetical protein